MPRKPTAHAQLDLLRQDAADERVKARDLEAQFKAAKVEVESASQAVTDAYAAEDAKLARQRRKELQAAEAQAIDLDHRVTAAGLRVERAQREVETFTRERARDLLGEREANARTVSADLSASVAETLRLAKAYVAERQAVDRLVAAVPGATPRNDGPRPEHQWEHALRTLERAYQQTPELEPPLPRWAGLEQRQQRDQTNRLLQLRRSKRLTDEEQRELDGIRREHGTTPAVATLRSGE